MQGVLLTEKGHKGTLLTMVGICCTCIYEGIRDTCSYAPMGQRTGTNIRKDTLTCTLKTCMLYYTLKEKQLSFTKPQTRQTT